MITSGAIGYCLLLHSSCFIARSCSKLGMELLPILPKTVDIKLLAQCASKLCCDIFLFFL